MNWGTHIQSGKLQEVDQLGSELSLAIHCPVHFPAYGKNLFECQCGVIFPLYLVKGKNWDVIIQKHIDEKELAKV